MTPVRIAVVSAGLGERLGAGRGGIEVLVDPVDMGLLQGDLVERVGRKLDALGDHAGAIRLDLDADIGVHHALVGDEDLHRCRGSFNWWAVTGPDRPDWS